MKVTLASFDVRGLNPAAAADLMDEVEQNAIEEGRLVCQHATERGVYDISDGRTFRVIKIRTMRVSREITTTVTTSTDARITPIGRLLRLSRIDELPQLVNVLVGDMSLVGPRPDVPGWADRLEGDDRVILRIRPGITGPGRIRPGSACGPGHARASATPGPGGRDR